MWLSVCALYVASACVVSQCATEEMARVGRQAGPPHHVHHAPHGPHAPPAVHTIGFLQQFCPRYGEWDTHKCWWPDTDYDDLPQACTQPVFANTDVPTWFLQMTTQKQREIYERLASEHQSRGAPKRCGYCSRTFRCRMRTEVDALPWCTRDQQMEMVADHITEPGACGDAAPCEMRPVEGSCPTPAFFKGVDYLNDRMAAFFVGGDGKLPPPGPIFTAHGGGEEADQWQHGPPPSGETPKRDGDDSEEIRSSVREEGTVFQRWPVTSTDIDRGGHGREKRQAGGHGPPPRANMLLAQIALSRQPRAMLAAISEMLTGTTCVKKPSGDACLCCCGPYVPSVADNECVDARAFLPSVGQLEAHLNAPHAGTSGADEFVQQQFIERAILPELQSLFTKHVNSQ